MTSISVELDDEGYTYAIYHAYKASMARYQRIQGNELQDKMIELELARQLGLCAWHVWRLGRNKGLAEYDGRRIESYVSGAEPPSDDYVSGQTVRVQGRVLREHGCEAAHSMVVRSHELGADLYVLALAATDENVGQVELVGYATAGELPFAPKAEGTYRGCHVLYGHDLHDMPENGDFEWGTGSTRFVTAATATSAKVTW